MMIAINCFFCAPNKSSRFKFRALSRFTFSSFQKKLIFIFIEGGTKLLLLKNCFYTSSLQF